jgi:hypothetical protein
MDHFPADTECEALVHVDADMVWCFGVIAEWRHNPKDGTWTAWVRYAAPDGNRIDTFPAHRLRHPQIDWSHGRTVKSCGSLER